MTILLFLPFSRNEDVRGGFDSPSLDGGLELLLLFLSKRFSKSAIFVACCKRKISQYHDQHVSKNFGKSGYSH